MSQSSLGASSSFNDLLAAGSIDDARTWLRSLIHMQETSLENLAQDIPNLSEVDAYDLHDQLNPKGVSLSIFLEDYALNQDALAQMVSQLAINGQDDIKLLLDFSSERIGISQFLENQISSLRFNYGFDSNSNQSDPCPPYTLGFPNVMMPSDLLKSLEKGDHDDLKQLVYDYTSRSWGHSFGDFDFFCQHLSTYAETIGNCSLSGLLPSIPKPGKSKHYVRLGFPSLFDSVLSAFFAAHQSSPYLQLFSFSPIELLKAIAQSIPGLDDNCPDPLSTVENFLAGMNSEQLSILISKVHFSDLFPADNPILDLSPSVIENINLYTALASSYSFIVPPLALNQHLSAFWACGTYLRHYPLPFLCEDQALQDVLNSLEQFDQAIKKLDHLDLVQIPEDMIKLSAEEAFQVLKDVFNTNDASSYSTSYFDQAWGCFQQALAL